MTKTIKSRDKYKSTIDFKTIFKFYFYVGRILQMKMIIFCTDSCGAREVLSSRVNKLEAKKLETWEFPVLQLPLLLRRYLVFQGNTRQGGSQNAFWQRVFPAQVYQRHLWELCSPNTDTSRETSSITSIFWELFSFLLCILGFSHCAIPNVCFLANHYCCVPLKLVFARIISYTVFIDIYDNETAVVKMRTIYITTALLGSQCSPTLQKKRQVTDTQIFVSTSWYFFWLARSISLSN